tara:strand:- start:4065 stop:4418 length:354 start_codon:yes stop_codon:yes gene_type:complete
MDSKKFLMGFLLFILLHILVWFSANTQFIRREWEDKALILAIVLAIPISITAFYGSRFIYDALGESAWSVRFIAFGASYLIFPLLTWLILKESMLNPKTLLCVALSLVIVCIQVFWK